MKIGDSAQRSLWWFLIRYLIFYITDFKQKLGWS